MHKVTSPEELLIKGLQELSISFSEAQVKTFMIYLTELRKWSRAYNLTSLASDKDIIVKHFLDSLLYLRAIPENRLSIMDVGSGAGFPGLPIKIMRPGIDIYLVEPSRKKAAFLRHIISRLCIRNTEVVEKRVEDLEAMDVDIAVTRALFDISEFCKKASHVIETGGSLILSKGPRVHDEIKDIEKGGLAVKVIEAPLPLTDIKRFLVIIRKKTDAFISSGGIDDKTAGYSSGTYQSCINAECRLRKAGCRGFQACPGFKSKA